MAVRFILGKSGTGKTTLCIDEIKESLLDSTNICPLLFLVPEQATYQAERAILSDPSIHGYGGDPLQSGSPLPGRLQVLSFSRLQFMLFGKRTARPQLSRIGRQMVIQRILKEQAENLKILSPSANSPGIARQMAVKQLSKKDSESISALKFTDIAAVLKRYIEFVEDSFMDPDVQLRRARQAVADASFCKGAKIWIDGFASFTTGQLAMLAELLKTASEVKIALCLDPKTTDLKKPKLQIENLFYPTQLTYTQLLELVKSSKLPLDQSKSLNEPERFKDAPDLAYVESSIFKDDQTKITSSGGIRIISAPTARAEAAFVAREILDLVRNKNLRYRDIAVIASNVEQYQHYIKACFEDYNIPFFLDRHLFLSQHPLSTLICSVFDILVNDFLQSDIFTYLKNDLLPIDRSDIDTLENYCIAFGCSPSDFKSETSWDFAGPSDTEFDEEQINKTRKKIVTPLLQLKSSLDTNKKITAGKFVSTLFDFLDSLNIRQTLSGWASQPEQSADEHRQFFENTIDLFDELTEVFGDDPLPAQDFITITKSAFSQITLAFIPPKLDEVLVGSIERSRHPDLKAVFLLGTTQSLFPVPLSYKGILSDSDRITAQSADFTLAADTTQTLAERQYLAYIAFTRPSQFLYVTYPLIDSKGSAIVRSQFIDNLQTLFEDLTEGSITETNTSPEHICTEIELAETLCSSLGKDAEKTDEDLQNILALAAVDEQLQNIASKVQNAVKYDNKASLTKDITHSLFGSEIRSSATRLSSFASCPYQFFAKYILGLKERKLFKLEPLDLGDFYHRVLDALIKHLSKAKRFLRNLKDKELIEILNRLIDQTIKSHNFLLKFKSHSSHNTYIINSACESLRQFVPQMAAMIKAGSFEPALSEVGFGFLKDTDDILGPYKIILSKGKTLLIRGKIDRLDIADINGKNTAVVFDYKRSARSFRWPYFYNGLDMQLPIYLLAVKNSTSGKPDIENIAGAFYIPVETGSEPITLDKLKTHTPKFDYKAKGIFNGQFAGDIENNISGRSWFYNFSIKKDGEFGDYNRSGALIPDDFEKVLEFTKEKIISLTDDMLRGTIDIHPYRLGTDVACNNFCPYKPLCRFDWQINDYSYLESVTKNKFLETYEQ
ncbi:MAG: PD-(D/E)XK nuclease family protein [Planctomycetota bacterium]|jgi:ATP-dependent helicase/nuclease subunit B